MSLSIEVPPDLERRLREAARRHGVEPADLTWQVLDEHLPPAHPEATPLLFPEWEELEQQEARPSAA